MKKAKYLKYNSPLTIQINLKVLRIKVDNRRADLIHKPLPRPRHMLHTSRRKNRHQLIERIKWLTGLAEVALGVRYIIEIGRERSVVVGKVPTPRRHPLVVILEHPLQPDHIMLRHLLVIYYKKVCKKTEIKCIIQDVNKQNMMLIKK